jgi:two-component system nitrate/nitrite response regulator NarL
VIPPLDPGHPSASTAYGVSQPARAPARTTAVRVQLIGNVCLYREGLAETLKRYPQLDVIAATDYAGWTECATRIRPDVLLLDVSGPGALALVESLRVAVSDAKVIVFGIEDSDDTVLAYAEAGVVAFIPRDCSIAHLVATIESAARGEALWSPRRTALLLRRVAELAAAARSVDARLDLTARETQIADCVAQGMSNKEIGAVLGIEVATVKNHVHKLLEKLRVARRGEAAALLRQTPGRPLGLRREAVAHHSSVR